MKKFRRETKPSSSRRKKKPVSSMMVQCIACEGSGLDSEGWQCHACKGKRVMRKVNMAWKPKK